MTRGILYMLIPPKNKKTSTPSKQIVTLTWKDNFGDNDHIEDSSKKASIDREGTGHENMAPACFDRYAHHMVPIQLADAANLWQTTEVVDMGHQEDRQMLAHSLDSKYVEDKIYACIRVAFGRLQVNLVECIENASPGGSHFV